ncbi:unnamed protein product [Moneuplotes crassus]|uniref:Uncharacterized protein n=1 Tax=Euplotes crassus TaxID=5936 RepID=A0AAD1X5Z3_EUPCR|nr:unnamed protein product [Moneuplotes crassus]
MDNRKHIWKLLQPLEGVTINQTFDNTITNFDTDSLRRKKNTKNFMLNRQTTNRINRMNSNEHTMYPKEKDYSQQRVYIHRETSETSDPANTMNIIIEDVEKMNPTVDYDTLMGKSKDIKTKQFSKLLNTTQKFVNIKKLKNSSDYILKNTPLPKLKLKRKNCMNLDTLSSDDSLNEVLIDYKVDPTESKEKKTNRALKNLVRQTTTKVLNSFKSNLSLSKLSTKKSDFQSGLSFDDRRKNININFSRNYQEISDEERSRYPVKSSLYHKKPKVITNTKCLRSPKRIHKSPSSEDSHVSMANPIKKPAGKSFRSNLAKKTIRKNQIQMAPQQQTGYCVVCKSLPGSIKGRKSFRKNGATSNRCTFCSSIKSYEIEGDNLKQNLSQDFQINTFYGKKVTELNDILPLINLRAKPGMTNKSIEKRVTTKSKDKQELSQKNALLGKKGNQKSARKSSKGDKEEENKFEQIDRENRIRNILEKEISKARPPVEYWRANFGDKLLCFENMDKLDLNLEL